MKLNIGIITFEASPTITENLKPALERRGHHVSLVRISDMLLSTFDTDNTIQSLLQYDIVYYRTSGIDPSLPFHVSRLLREKKRVCLNGVYDIHPHINRKTYQAVVAGRSGTRMPKTYAAADPIFADMVSHVGVPFVAKRDISSQGRDVHRVDTEEDYKNLPEVLPQNRYLFQEYIPHESDYRVHMLGNKAVAAYRRVPSPGDFRANVSRGGTMERVETKKRELLFARAESLAPHFGLDICAIDFLESTIEKEFYFAEVNLNPGWEYRDIDATGVDINTLTMEYIEERATEATTKKSRG